MTGYEQIVKQTFDKLCEELPKGVSPVDVTARMAKDGTISTLDTVIDIADIMRRLRSRGEL